MYLHLPRRGQWLSSLISFLIEPPPDVQGPERRFQAALLASLMLFGLFVLAIIGLGYLMTGHVQSLSLACLAVIPLVAAYLLSRTRHYRWVLPLAISVTFLGTVAALLLNHNLGVVGSVYVIIMVCAQFYSWRISLVTGLVVGISILMLAAFIDPSVWITMVGQLLLGVVLATAFAANHQHRLRQIAETNQALSEGETRYRALFEQAHDSVFLISMEGVFIDVNHHAAQTAGYGLDELIGMDFHQLIVCSQHERVDQMESALLKGDTMPPVEYTLLRKDGEQVPIEITVSLIRDVQGKPMFAQSIVRDITDRKRAEDQRLELQTERARVEAMKQFVGETSHDLRTPISVITTSLYLLRKKLPPEHANMRQLDALESQTQHMAHILENLGRLSDLDDDATPFSFGSVNLNTLVDRLVEQFQPVAQQHSLTLNAELSPSKLVVRADDVQLTRAVQNLMNNALNYTLSGGHVTVRVCREDDAHAILEVRDTGIGIPPESLPHIFERFYRADVARPAYMGGMGLGLTITRRIVDMHGGMIEVESQPGQGSCFRIRLPLPETDKPSTANPASQMDHEQARR